MENILIGLIIGGNCPEDIEPIPNTIIRSQNGGPFAYCTELGWCVIGAISTSNSETNISSEVTCARTMVLENDKFTVRDAGTGGISNHHFSTVKYVNESYISRSLKSMYELEFSEQYPEEHSTSHEDDKFLDIMNRESSKEGNHHILPLPFRNQQPNFPNNRHVAMARLQYVRKRMARDQTFKTEYTKFIDNMISNRYAQKCLLDYNDKSSKPWYLPHHGVFHPSKGKLRVVFDCSATYQEKSLNSELLQGPDLINGLLGVLLRFREGTIAFMADIEAMYCQVRVPSNQHHYQRFLWWPNGNIHGEVADYEMCVHTFGATSSPSCANFALRKTASDKEEEFGKDAAESLRRNFYVDDYLKSVDSGLIGASLLQRVRDMLYTGGGFNLTKVMSNSSLVMNATPPEHCALSISQRNLSKSPLIERALGVSWCIENDTLNFRITLQDSPLTRRGILSIISHVYDPFGSASPFLLKARKILQEITCDSLGWDEPVSDVHRVAWEKWRKQLPLLNNIKIRRCFKSDSFGEVTKATLHGFSDAAPSPGYGFVFYLRLVNKQGQIEVCNVLAKSRVSPLNKPVTLPRLELNAADLSSKFGLRIKKELELKCEAEYYWVDSMVTLGYIHNDNRRFKTFVANRQKRIRSITEKYQWRFIAGEDNPADATSRGISLEDKALVDLWFQGPEFLHQPEESWKYTIIKPVADDDPELKTTVTVNTLQLNMNMTLLTRLEERISCWGKMVRVLAIMMLFCQRCRKTDNQTSLYLLSTCETKKAETALFKMIQCTKLPEELKFYSQNKSPPRNPNKKIRSRTNIWKLDPYVDETGLLRVGGRLKKAAVNHNVKHPVILPNSCKAVQRLVEYQHKEIKHCGRTSTMNKLRSEGYWVVSLSSIVRSVIHHCVPCKKLRGRMGEQKMAELPESRSLALPPFTHVGLDMFGPYYVKDGRKQRKRFVALFTCLGCRAVHLEVTFEMTTDSFIQALRRFLARRGPVESITTDN